jgi:hypothetical protein
MIPKPARLLPLLAIALAAAACDAGRSTVPEAPSARRGSTAAATVTDTSAVTVNDDQGGPVGTGYLVAPEQGGAVGTGY